MINLTKTIKIIDLFVKIANGEEVPKRIKYRRGIYEWNGQYYMSTIHNADMEYLSFDEYFCITGILNDEVEIIEDTPKEDKKIENKARFQYSQIPPWFDTKEVIRVVNNNFERHQQALNEIIDKINGGE